MARYGPVRSRHQIWGLILSAISLAALVLVLDPSELLGDDFAEYIDRAGSVQSDLLQRFQVLGLYAAQRGLDISGGIGLGVGTLAQTGASGVAGVQGAGFVFVSESGIGKVFAELGWPGIVVLLFLFKGLYRALHHSLRMMKYESTYSGCLEIGLLSLALSNLPFFSAAAGVYGDPFVLIISGLSLGSVFAVPTPKSPARLIASKDVMHNNSTPA